MVSQPTLENGAATQSAESTLLAPASARPIKADVVVEPAGGKRTEHEQLNNRREDHRNARRKPTTRLPQERETDM